MRRKHDHFIFWLLFLAEPLGSSHEDKLESFLSGTGPARTCAPCAVPASVLKRISLMMPMDMLCTLAQTQPRLASSDPTRSAAFDQLNRSHRLSRAPSHVAASCPRFCSSYFPRSLHTPTFPTRRGGTDVRLCHW
ncbi:hypothetical protein BKA66DRAFT_186444 [Pyrenochaeta sp. MPI-SDFR-AT-0127]|nr:hypothetical protein BKA66DRAFT_186444 [Pyrenochaeta sp. MPI-SDFR-AT-0127]